MSSIPALAARGMWRQRVFAIRRTLATGVVYIDQLPSWANKDTVREVAEHHGHVYGVWLKQRPSRSSALNMHAANERRLHGHMAAVRITTEKVPEGLGSIAQLPDPTQGEVQGCWALLRAVVAELGLSGIDAVPILKDPDMFQVVARQALGLGLNTRLFDKKATETPKYTQGLRDGYRKGFLEGRRRADTEDLLGQCEESGDELEFMTAYFEYSR